jgi:hypothetical protein
MQRTERRRRIRKNQSLTGRWEWWSDSVWQEGQVFPLENMGHLSAVMCPKFRFGVNYFERNRGTYRWLETKMGMNRDVDKKARSEKKAKADPPPLAKDDN